jgi:hypothetical protein
LVSGPGDAIEVRQSTDGERIEVAPSATASAVADRFERLFVHGVFALLAAGLFVYVWEYGRNVPFWDDWRLVPVLAGYESADLSWLWLQNNQHRYPVTRLAVLAIWRVTEDFRAAMAVTALAMCALAFAMIRTARAVRGRTSFADAFFPLALLHWGHFENLLFASQLFFVTPAVLCCGVFLVAVRDRWRGNPRALAAMGAMLVLTPLHGAMGVVLAVPMALWAAAAGASRWRDRDAPGRRDARILFGVAGLTAVVSALYFVGLESTVEHPPSPGLLADARTALEILSNAIGPGRQQVWVLKGFGVLGLLVMGIGLAGAAASRRTTGRLRALAVVCCLGAFAVLVLAIAHGRSGFGPGQGFSNRYAIYSAAPLCVAYLAFSLYAPARLGFALRGCLFVVACVMLPSNHANGKAFGIDRAARGDALLRDASRGLPASLLARRHVNRVYPEETTLAERLEMLRQARLSPFTRARSQGRSCARASAVAAEVVATHDLDWQGSHGVATGPDPYVVLALPRARYVCTIDVTLTLVSPSEDSVLLEAFWMRSGTSDFRHGERFDAVVIPSSPAKQVVTLWIADTVDQVRLDTGTANCEVAIDEVVTGSW